MNQTAIEQIDFIYTFVIPSICFYGLVTNLINLFIFSNRQLSNIIYKYLIIYTVSNLYYFIISFLIFLPRCGVYCTFSQTYLPQYYLYLFYNYLKNISSYFNIFIQILVSFQRLAFVLNLKWYNLNHVIIITISLIILSTLLNLPLLLTKEIKIGLVYSVVLNDFGKSLIGKWLVIIVSILKGFVLITIILVINLITMYKLKHRMNIKKAIKYMRNNELNSNEKKANRNLTVMVITLGFFNSICYIPNSTAYIMQQIFDNNHIFYRVFLVCSNTIFLCIQSSDIFVYYFFNKYYRRIFNKYLIKIFKK
ncbi:unnamed protein product [Brachionus calyciflorus]|uniref:G-protein coupled receptors family 1 profile domain-containing protein n=1 Tax=Brachionus calyciflorus TaxID=104777 RepID=A0A814CSU1_9BILA|nr:unnamed protein product [Brachionus calyciflorus]